MVNSTLDSAHYTDVYSSDMIGQVVEGLYRQDKNGDPELAMAKAEPQVSEDGLRSIHSSYEKQNGQTGIQLKQGIL